MMNLWTVLSACENPAILKVISFLNQLLNIVFIVVPIGLILMFTIDLAKNVIGANGDAFSKNLHLGIKRIIFSICLFLVPVVVEFFLGFISDIENNIKQEYNTCFDNINNIEFYENIYNLEKQKEDEEYEDYLKQLDADSRFRNSAIKYSVKSGSSSSSGTHVGQKYNLSDDNLKRLTAKCYGEQGSAGIEAMKAEASLMANLTEKAGYSDVYSYVVNGGWFGKVSSVESAMSSNLQYVTDEMVDAIKEVLVYGKRNVPLYIDEHDCWFCNSDDTCGEKGFGPNIGDICYIKVNGQTHYSKDAIKNWSNYKQDETVIQNVYGSTYTFYTYFSGNSDSDPFGYTAASKARFND